ncbi:hypothetical protein [Shouchella lonarensis]|uniref:Lipase (Class 3) n=1 Tax=Shouchella lonarensis TaxID=1464122 RepID=A0A1G6IJT3_9BACI|nr:hypothetical protein [Shouchella lonarensis]SDC06670.1 hypothetical protein SAMN05421737_10586 [Shouchella lonarensis]
MSNKKSIGATTDAVYQHLSSVTYNKGDDSPYEVGKSLRIRTDKPDGSWSYERWEVVDIIQNDTHDVHAIAVKKGDEVVISYRGTDATTDSWAQSYRNNIKSAPPREDVGHDLRNARRKLQGKEPIERTEEQKRDNPYDVANNFANQVHKKYSNSRITVTGHSEGGRKALYVHVNNPNIASATTFSTPSAYDLFTAEQKERINAGDFDKSIRQYRVDWDFLGNLQTWWNPKIGTEIKLDTGSMNMYDNHLPRAYDKFFDDEGMILDGIAPYDGYHPDISPTGARNMMWAGMNSPRTGFAWGVLGTALGGIGFQSGMLQAAINMMYPRYMTFDILTGSYAFERAMFMMSNSGASNVNIMPTISKMLANDPTLYDRIRSVLGGGMGGSSSHILANVQILNDFHMLIRCLESITPPARPGHFIKTKSPALTELLSIGNESSHLAKVFLTRLIDGAHREVAALEKYWDKDKELAAALKLG